MTMKILATFEDTLDRAMLTPGENADAVITELLTGMEKDGTIWKWDKSIGRNSIQYALYYERSGHNVSVIYNYARQES